MVQETDFYEQGLQSVDSIVGICIDSTGGADRVPQGQAPRQFTVWLAVI